MVVNKNNGVWGKDAVLWCDDDDDDADTGDLERWKELAG